MKKQELGRRSKVKNWLKHRETRDEIWDYMASKWAVKAERIANYGRTHLPKPVKNVMRTTIKKPLSAAAKYRVKRKNLVKVPKRALTKNNASE